MKNSYIHEHIDPKNDYIEELDLPTRLENTLKNAHVHTLSDLIYLPEDELFYIKNIGPKSMEILNKKLSEYFKTKTGEVKKENRRL